MDLCTNISRECCYSDQGQAFRCPYGQSCYPSCGQTCCPETNRYPVAMAFVPWQQWQPTYVPEQGLIEGTIFPDLNLPFHCGRCGV